LNVFSHGTLLVLDLSTDALLRASFLPSSKVVGGENVPSREFSILPQTCAMVPGSTTFLSLSSVVSVVPAFTNGIAFLGPISSFPSSGSDQVGSCIRSDPSSFPILITYNVLFFLFFFPLREIFSPQIWISPRPRTSYSAKLLMPFRFSSPF